MASSKNTRSSDVRTTIITESTRLFGQRGFEGTSLEAIALGVGIKRPSLLYYFSSKEDLRDAVINHMMEDWANELPRILTEAANGYDRFSSTMASVVEFFLSDQNRARLTIRELLDRPDELRALVHKHLSSWTHLLADYIRLGQESKTIRKDVDPESYIIQIMMMVVGTVAIGPVAADIIGVGDDTADERFKELLRVARVSLFVEPEKQ